MSEIVYLVKLSDYEEIKPQIKAYEVELMNTYGLARPGSRPESGPNEAVTGLTLEDMRNLIRSKVKAVAVDSFEVAEEARKSMRSMLRRVRDEDASTYSLLQAIYQAIGIEPDDIEVFLARAEQWSELESNPTIQIYERAVSEGLAVVTLAAE